MPTVNIDGIEYQTEPGRNMLQVVLDNKLDLPYFCWHPAMGSVGACRLCAVKVFKGEQDSKGRIDMACMTPAVDGTRISLSDPEAADFRKHVIEWLMINHPHDCPVCDEGGECHLQDMTAMCGHVYRRYRGRKRTHNNQNLGPFVNHEMNRCIQCYRCTRFYRDYAGGRDFNVFASKNHVYFGRAEDGALESEFSGNLVEVCPTGVFTDKTLKKHYTRKWDLETAPSVCIHCGLGCNTLPGARYGTLRRIRSRYNSDVNGYFICDRGRYGYEFVNGEMRIRRCFVGSEAGLTQVSWDEALGRVAGMLRDANGLVGIGSPRASLEANYALKKLVGDAVFSTGLSAYAHDAAQLALQILRDGPVRAPSLAEVQSSDVILLLGVDPTNEAPMLDLAIRQAMRGAALDISRKLKIPDWDANAVGNALQGAKGKLYIMMPWGSKLDEIAAEVRHISYPDIAWRAGEICKGIESSAPPSGESPSGIAEALFGAKHPLVITSIAAGRDVLAAAADLVQTLFSAGTDCRLSIVMPEANTMGVSMLGGTDAGTALGRLASGEADTLIVLENDLSRRVSQPEFRSALDKAKNIIVMDSVKTATTAKADIVLPVPAYVECNGTFVNSEGRAQRFFQVFVPAGEARPVWQIVSGLGAAADWPTHEDALRHLAEEIPGFAPALDAAPGSEWRSAAGQKIARESHRFTGRTAMDADKTVFEPQPPDDPETPFTFSMDGSQNPPPGPLVNRFWWPGWNSENSVTKFQTEVNGPLLGGNSGRRLIEPSTGWAATGRKADEDASAGAEWIAPRAYIFGSDELSRFAQGIAQLILKAEIRIHPDYAERLGVADGESLEFDVDGETIRLPVRLDASAAVDTASVPAGFPETTGIVAPIKSTLRKAR